MQNRAVSAGEIDRHDIIGSASDVLRASKENPRKNAQTSLGLLIAQCSNRSEFDGLRLKLELAADMLNSEKADNPVYLRDVLVQLQKNTAQDTVVDMNVAMWDSASGLSDRRFPHTFKNDVKTTIEELLASSVEKSK